MPKKRTTVESSNDEQTNEGSDLYQEDNNAKRAKLVSLNDTTLQDLPIELLFRILVKAVAMEVMVTNVKLAKSVRKEKADLVIRRLGTVCSQWNSILTTNFFRTELNRILDGTGQRAIRLEILIQLSLELQVIKLTTLKDEIFMLYNTWGGGGSVINVYDRNNIAEMKDVIPTTRIEPEDMAGCSVSNCVYILGWERYCPAIFRITKGEEHHFYVSPWINYLRLPGSDRGPISVSANGDLIIFSIQRNPEQVHGRLFGLHWDKCKQVDVVIFNANGSLQHEISLSPDIYGFRDVYSVIQKSNGSLVLVSANDQYKAKVLEIDMTGTMVRQYQSSLGARGVVSFADNYGRILINDGNNRIELLDSEFNLVEINGPRLLEGGLNIPPLLHYNSERNEIVRVDVHKYDVIKRLTGNVLNIFRFIEE